jgi:hypothetical protein
MKKFTPVPRIPSNQSGVNKEELAMDGIHSPLTSGADNLDEVKASDARLSPREHTIVRLMGMACPTKRSLAN